MWISVYMFIIIREDKEKYVRKDFNDEIIKREIWSLQIGQN